MSRSAAQRAARWPGTRGSAVFAAVACAFAIALFAAGCTAPEPIENAPAVLPIEAMTPSAKRATIATSFPAEVPVPIGDFARAQAQGEDAWDYEVEVATTIDKLAIWYRDAYLGRQWELLGEEPVQDQTGRRVSLRFRKGNAESSVTVSESESGGPVRASVTLGLGTPVLQMQ